MEKPVEEKMDDQKIVENKKNPLGAAILSALCPGMGFFYLGNFIKGITYMLILASLIVLAAHGRGAEIPVFVLMCVGFHIFQIFDSFDEATKINRRIGTGIEHTEKEQNISLPAAAAVLFLGIVLQLATLDIIDFRDILRLWPLVLIVIGFRYVYTYMKSKETNKGGSNE